VPKIAVINESTAAQDLAIKSMMHAFGEQWNVDLRPVWGVDGATFTYFPAEQAPPSGAWWLIFLDDSDQANSLAYHDLTNEGLPISKVFVKTIFTDKTSLSVGATHELCEMAVDPWLNSAYQDADGVFWAGEICDPVEDDRYGYEINGTLVTDFVAPTWFAHMYSNGSMDFKTHARNAFEVLTGGYAQKFDPNKGWVQVTGAAARHSKGAAAPVGSRRERRTRKRADWKRSERQWPPHGKA
jgi:hypothetical protein